MQGFYKYDSNQLLFADTITIPDHPAEDIGIVTLTLDNHNDWEYPILGWYYCDSEENAKEFFGIKE